VHEVALIEDQVTVEILPDVMLVGFAEIVTVGGGVVDGGVVDGGVVGGGVFPPPPATGPGVGVGVGGVEDANAEQLAVVPLLEPLQLHVHGPEPATDDATPVEQRLVEGLDDACVPLADPHTPLTGAGLAPRIPSPFRSCRKIVSID
jgi:hypothetical protein